LNIAVIGIKGIPARYGGFETCVDETSKRLRNYGVNITVYCRKYLYEEYLPEYEGIKLKYIPSVKTKNLATISSTLFSVIDIILSKTRIVHIYTAGNAIFIPILKLFGKKCVISVDALDWKRKKWGKFASYYIKTSEKIAVRFADSIISDSQVICEYYLKNYNRKIDYVAFGSNTNTGPANDETIKKYSIIPKKYFIFVGLFRPEKNVDMLIKAFNQAKTKDFSLVLLGDDPLNLVYSNYIYSLKTDKIVFLGRKYGLEYEEISKNAYCYVTASEVEGTSPALVAAMGFITAVLVSSIPENLETIGDSGFVFENNNIQSLIDQIEYLINNPDRVIEYASKAFERSRNKYSWDKIAMDFLNIYNRLLG